MSGRTVTPGLTTDAELTTGDAVRTSNVVARATHASDHSPAVVPAGASPDARPVAVTTDLPALREDHAIERTGEP